MMAQSTHKIDVYIEAGKRRTFAGAIDWPGWSRTGRDEETALQALFEYGPRYGRVLHETGLEFQAPVEVSAFNIIERLEGNSTTDFGAPDVAPSSDMQPLDEAGLQRLEALLKACWQAFDSAVLAARGKELRKGPRGGGRDVEGIVRHVLGSEAGYLASFNWKLKKSEEKTLEEELKRTRQAVLDALESAVRDGLPERGPRGGAIWRPRYFVRREAWHVLDHVWEIEDRIL